MAFKDYLPSKRAVKRTALALIAGAVIAECATLKSDRIYLPSTESATLTQRINPLNALIDVPKAASFGTAIASLNLDDLKNSTNSYSRLDRAKIIGTGILDTSLDSCLNVLLWIPKEIYEASTGKKFQGPYMPFTASHCPQRKINLTY